ncbi:FAD-dependent oxidoreductase [Rhizohabitans arisaemae]|uniref:FAD-dependent oxidoreductase n=1 Tax=Rhizohabitans arisaemae TaxID=2720610 RepID=UPI0024B27E9D|nr:FAD-dependent oxidoreductase [Rhizohabitans arisaemae]
MRALICGAGIAGLTLAWHLERDGWDVKIVERAPRFRHGGYMIDFYGPGMEVAKQMGIRPRLLATQYPIDEVDYVNGEGRRTSGVTFTGVLGDGLNVMREDLAQALHDEVRSPIVYSTSIESIRRHADSVAVRLTDGTREEVDLLVGADGAHSRVRELTFGPEEHFVRYLGRQTAAYTLKDEELHREIGMRFRSLTVPGLMVAAYSQRDDGLAVLFLRQEPDPRLPDDIVAELTRHYGHLGWILPKVLSLRPPASEIYYDQVNQVEMDEWSKGRVVLIGDACQAVSLFAGYGASLAMAGAWVLADELRGAGRHVPGALTRYHARMAGPVAEIQRFGRQSLEWVAPGTRGRIVARDMFMRLMNLPGANRLMVAPLATAGKGLIKPHSAPLIDQTGRA